jgi:hypothetical protein
MKIPLVRVSSSPVGGVPLAPIKTPKTQKTPQKEAPKPVTRAPEVAKPVLMAPAPKKDTAALSEKAKDMAALLHGKTAAEEAKESAVVEAREEQGKQGE